MTVEVTSYFSGPYITNGATTVFPFSFISMDADELGVLLRDADGVDTVVSTSLYSVTRAADGTGSVVFSTAPASGSDLYIFSDVSFAQSVEFEDGSGWKAAPVNSVADRSAARDIWLKGRVDRSLITPIGESPTELPSIDRRIGKFLAFDAAGNPVAASGTASTDEGLREDIAAINGASLIGNRLSAGSNLRTQTVSEFIEGGALQIGQFSGVDEGAQLVNALTEATASRDGGQGQTVQIPRGEFDVATPFNIPNRAALVGVNKRGSRIKAASGFVGSYMATVDNGTSSMFDNRLAHLTLDCNDVAGLGGIDSQAWQEGGGLENVLVQKFRTHGLRFREMEGGAALVGITDSEIFGSSSGCDAGILLDDPSLVGAFQLNIERTTIAGGGALPASMTRGIDVQGGSLFVSACHVETCETGIYLDGNGNHVINGFNGGSGAALVTNLVEIAATFTGSLTMIGCQRNGGTNFLKDNRANGFGTIAYDIPFLQISSEAPLSKGAIVASASIDGAAGTPVVTKGFGITSITDNGTGDYTLTLTRSAQTTTDFTVVASQNASGWVRCDLNGANSVRLRCYNASGVLTDQNEIKVIIVRVA